MSEVPTIAIVDDDASVRRAVQRLLRAAGMRAQTFASGDAFLQSLDGAAAPRPACVILDVQMPGLTGLDVQARLGGALPIIFVSAYDEAHARDQALEAGAVAFLRKPFSDQLLIETLREVLGEGGR
ncbi:MAG TPA: response regulator [Burkholderiales bacterium]|nr:response regulator [Burkholderiales bacterium]